MAVDWQDYKARAPEVREPYRKLLAAVGFVLGGRQKSTLTRPPK